MLANFFQLRFIVSAIVLGFITTLLIVAQAQNIDKIDDEIFFQESYDNLCMPNWQIDQNGVILSGIEANFSIQPMTFGYKVGKVNRTLFGQFDESELQEHFTYAYQPQLIWEAWAKHNRGKAEFVDIKTWVSGVVASEYETATIVESDPIVIVADRNERNRKWWQLEEFVGYSFNELPGVKSIASGLSESDAMGIAIIKRFYERFQHPDAGKDVDHQSKFNNREKWYGDPNFSVLFETLCQLKRIESEKWTIGLPIEADVLESMYGLLVEQNDPLRVTMSEVGSKVTAK